MYPRVRVSIYKVPRTKHHTKLTRRKEPRDKIDDRSLSLSFSLFRRFFGGTIDSEFLEKSVLLQNNAAETGHRVHVRTVRRGVRNPLRDPPAALADSTSRTVAHQLRPLDADSRATNQTAKRALVLVANHSRGSILRFQRDSGRPMIRRTSCPLAAIFRCYLRCVSLLHLARDMISLSLSPLPSPRLSQSLTFLFLSLFPIVSLRA